jgi:hypothetical protein
VAIVPSTVAKRVEIPIDRPDRDTESLGEVLRG